MICVEHATFRQTVAIGPVDVTLDRPAADVEGLVKDESLGNLERSTVSREFRQSDALGFSASALAIEYAP